MPHASLVDSAGPATSRSLSPVVVRCAGLAGSVLLAVAAQLGGARSPWRPTMTPRTMLADLDGVLLPLCWLAGSLLLVGAWVVGWRAVPSARWAYVTAALWVVPLLPLLPLGSYDVYSYACQGWQQAHGLDPYAAGVDVLGCPWRAAVAPTWLDSPAPYGPVFLVLAAAAAKAGGSLAGTVAALRVVSLLGVVLIGVCLPRVARRCGVPLGRAVRLALACPLVAVHLVSGAHNDAVMVGLLVAALAVIIGRDAGADAGARPARLLVPAGILIGLAVGVKVTAVVVAPFAVLAAVPPRSALRELWRPAAAVGGGAIGAIAAVGLASGLGFGWVTNLAGSGVSVQWTSPPTAVGMTVDLVASWFGARPNAVPVTRVLGIAVLAAVLVVLWWRARGGDALPAAGVALAATVVLAPVFHPWYATWPLVLLAATRDTGTPRLVVPCAVAALLCLPDGYNLALAVKAQGAVAMTALLIYLGVRAVRRHRGVRTTRRAAA
jgi:alpha-1,6-mannosyltransferase